MKELIENYYIEYNENERKQANCYFSMNLGQYNYETQLWYILGNKDREDLISKDKAILKNLDTHKNKNLSDGAIFRLRELSDEEFYLKITENDRNNNITLITEGKTDWKHIQKALKRFQQEGEYRELYNLDFFKYEYSVEMGDISLCQQLEKLAKDEHLDGIYIVLFDRDNKKIKEKFKKFKKRKNNDAFLEISNLGNENFYKKNCIYTFRLPKIDNIEEDEVCIEWYYLENELKTQDKEGKRIFLGKEFDNGKFKEENTNEEYIVKYHKNPEKIKKFAILDGSKKNKRVYKKGLRSDTQMTLSKNDFAENILNDIKNFDNFNIENFKKIFDVMKDVVKDVVKDARANK